MSSGTEFLSQKRGIGHPFVARGRSRSEIGGQILSRGKVRQAVERKRTAFDRLGNSALGLTISSGIMRPTLRNHGHVTEIRIFFRELERQIPLDFRLRSGLDVQKYALRRLKMPVSCFARGSGHGIAKLRD